MPRRFRTFWKVARGSAEKWHVLETLLSHPHACSSEAPLVQLAPPSPISVQQVIQSTRSSASSLLPGQLELRNPDPTSSSAGSRSSQFSRHRSFEEVLGAGDIEVDSFELQISDEEEDAAAAEEEHTDTREVQPKAPQQAKPRHSLYPYHAAYPANPSTHGSGSRYPTFVPFRSSDERKHGMRKLKGNLGNSVWDSPNDQAQHRQVQPTGNQHEASGKDISHPHPLSSSPPGSFAVGSRPPNLGTPSACPQRQFNPPVIPAALFDGRPSTVLPSDPYIHKPLPPLPSAHPAILRPGHSAVATRPHQDPALRHSYAHLQLRWQAFLYLRGLHYDQMRSENARRGREEVGYYYTHLTGALEDWGEFEFDAWKF